MKAVFHTQYGPPELLQLEDVDKPIPGDHDLLIKVHATSVSSGDCNSRNLTFVYGPMRAVAKLMFGITKPWKKTILGTQLAGEVEAVGAKVTKFKPGDSVFASTGMSGGGHAQFACLNEKGAIAIKPENLSWEEAVAIPFGADTALTYLQDIGNIQAGHELLILGASGSIGTAAIQIAKQAGATVTGVCSGPKVDLVKSLGADEVIDYTKQDFSENGKTYDRILDTFAVTTFAACKKSLKSDGIYLPCIMSLSDMLVRIPWTAIRGGKRLKGGIAIENASRMKIIKEMAEAGTLKPVIDQSWSLEQIAEAFRRAETGHKKGSVVITVSHP